MACHLHLVDEVDRFAILPLTVIATKVRRSSMYGSCLLISYLVLTVSINCILTIPSTYFVHKRHMHLNGIFCQIKEHQGTTKMTY
jgi:hypothetical protein